MNRAVIRLNGVVQGVGFRPFVYRLAHEYHLTGKVYNSATGVVIEVEGDREEIAVFYQAIPERKPPLATILERTIEWLSPLGYTDFQIEVSHGAEQATVLVAPDVGICADCTKELFDPTDRRYEYPFINCTNCGPRFTIINELPYDRPFTSMDVFPMCPECRQEYEDPGNRRFHAQPNACSVCGPTVWYNYGPNPPENLGTGAGALATARTKLKDGAILAVKGLGGFHLICDATKESAVARLRQRKQRPDKPFAVMCRDLDVVRRYCVISKEEERILTAWQKPIVLLQKKPGASNLAPAVAPGLDRLGVMLAYTPLHLLLFGDGLECLVATSANFSDYPLVTTNEVAWEMLRPIVDGYLFHNRIIVNRCDDSVVRVEQGECLPIRRARGFAPQPLVLPLEAGRTLAFGGDEKNTFCLTRDQDYFVSQHIGELNNLESLQYLETAIDRFQHYFQVQPELVVHDLHPEYRSTKTAKAWANKRDLPIIAVQHHQAHLASCLVEHGYKGPVLGVICDGTGYGTDGRLWGFELFRGSLPDFQRIGHLAYTPLPGGEVAIREPWRMAFSHLYTYLGSAEAQAYAATLGAMGQRSALVQKQLDLGINAPLTSSAGRFFDAVAAFLGVRLQGTYEGQPAIELEIVAKASQLTGRWNEALNFNVYLDEGNWQVDPRLIWQDLWSRKEAGEDAGNLAARFHHTIAKIIIRLLELANSQGEPINTVALSGGVFQNSYLTQYLAEHLSELGYHLLFPRQLPVNDGGISAGQAILGYMLTRG